MLFLSFFSLFSYSQVFIPFKRIGLICNIGKCNFSHCWYFCGQWPVCCWPTNYSFVTRESVYCYTQLHRWRDTLMWSQSHPLCERHDNLLVFVIYRSPWVSQQKVLKVLVKYLLELKLPFTVIKLTYRQNIFLTMGCILTSDEVF